MSDIKKFVISTTEEGIKVNPACNQSIPGD